MRRSRTIILKPEQRIIQAELNSGHFRSPDEVSKLREKEHKSKAAAPRKNLVQFRRVRVARRFLACGGVH